MTKTKTKQMRKFSEEEWAIADKEHFGKKGRWKEENFYISAIKDKEIIGMLHYSLKAGVMEIITIIISHKHRKQGIGKNLMRQAEKIAREKGAHKLYLITGKDWESNAFYEKLEFVQAGELKSHYLKKDWIEFSKFI